MPQARSSLLSKFSLTLISLALVYLAINLAVFSLFAPFKTTVAGMKVSFTTLDTPLQIFLLLFLLGLFIRYRQRGYDISRPHWGVVVFCVVLLIYLNSGATTSFDSRWTIPTAKSIIKEGNANLDEYRDQIVSPDYRVEEIRGHLYSVFPVGPSLICVPVIWLFNDDVVRETYADVERLIASLIMAAAAALFYLLAFQVSRNAKAALLIVFVFAFCSSAWSTASRGLWQHGPSILMLTAFLYFVVLAKTRPAIIQYASLPLVFSFIVRPTNAISLAAMSIFVLWQHRRYFGRFLAWSLLLVLPFFLYNFSIYHSLLSPYYLPQRVGSFRYFLPALAGNLISPSRGFLIFSPVFAFSIYGLFWKLRSRKWEKLDSFVLAIIIVHWLSISSFSHWWGGHSYGPRFFSDMIPYLTYFLIPAMMALSLLNTVRKKAAVALFVLLMAMSFFIHLRGARTRAVYEWDYTPVDVDAAPQRVWDWHDPQFLRGLF
jgi:hypothetical protein